MADSKKHGPKHHSPETRRKIGLASRKAWAAKRGNAHPPGIIDDETPQDTYFNPRKTQLLNGEYAGETEMVTVPRKRLKDVEMQGYKTGLWRAARLLLNLLEGGY